VNFFNIGPSELIVIVIIAVLAIGPRRMVQLARSLGRTAGKLRRMSSEFMALINAELRETGEGAQQVVKGVTAGAGEFEGQVQATGEEVGETVRQLRQEIGSLRAELEAAALEARAFIKREAQAVDEEEGAPAKAAQRPAEPATPGAPGPAAPPAEAAAGGERTAPRVLGALGGLEGDAGAAQPAPPAAVSGGAEAQEKAGEDEGTRESAGSAAGETEKEAA
jgi:sec-independent protein translocase protein TatB